MQHEIEMFEVNKSNIFSFHKTSSLKTLDTVISLEMFRWMTIRMRMSSDLMWCGKVSVGVWNNSWNITQATDISRNESSHEWKSCDWILCANHL